MFLYGWLHLSGFPLPLDEIKRFRQLHSLTPGHPEFEETAPGVECTTGPLGQGVANAVGFALSQKMAAARFNTPEHKIFDSKVFCLAGDGCLQEGVSAEAASFAGHFGLDNLVLLYDSNDVTLDAMAKETQSEDTAKRFEAYGFEVQTVHEGHNLEALAQALDKAKHSNSGKPHFIVVKTIIAKGIPEVAGTQKGHGEAGVKFGDAARKALGLPEEKYYVAPETRAYFEGHQKKLQHQYEGWVKAFDAWKAANPQLASLLASAQVKPNVEELLSLIPPFPADAKIATRKAGSDVLQPLAKHLTLFMSGSADLHGSTLNYIAGAGDFSRSNYAGRNLRYGIREHAMASICNGVSYHRIFRPSCATFLVFSDYCRPSIRIAALSHLPVVYIFTHDSVGVGEDGPTHQPVETVSGLRVIPNLDVIRPGDPEETAGAFAAALERVNGPTLLALTRQNLPTLNHIDVKLRREGVLRGAYVAQKEKGDLKLILIGTGSELQHAIDAAAKLGDGVRVVSFPCFSRFERQPKEYREEVLPSSCRKRIAIEAGVTALWYKYVGFEGRVIGVDRFGLSAPGPVVMKELGITAEHVLQVAHELLQ
eukprot:TRINITY_DN99_c0_g2_i5.p1 TRINITY_DN99_c0_g2~~TRINITY_DN99_c0_g2_i5.p1  ORF type:complete len:594 (+),score=226.81 TRINITY_DN99_c0_g2_i5:325-2106(+)